jgi:hypothetical protein
LAANGADGRISFAATIATTGKLIAIAKNIKIGR